MKAGFRTKTSSSDAEIKIKKREWDRLKCRLKGMITREKEWKC